ncbi:MAG: fibronectin type III domain-containing protein [Bacteroidota bacterium]
MKKITLLLLLLFVSVSGYSQLYNQTEGFDSMTAPTGALPIIWPSPQTGNWAIFERNSPSTVGTGENWELNTTLFHSAPQSAWINREQIGAGNTSEDFLATSVISVPATGITELHFWTRLFTSGNQGTIFKVMVAPVGVGAQTDPNIYSDLAEWTELNLIEPASDFNVWTEKTVNLSESFQGMDIYVAFVRVYTQPDGNIGGDRWLIDDVGVYSQCTAPTTLTIASTTSTTANLTWANPSGATTWEIEVIPSVGAPITYPAYSNPSPTFTATGLTPNTTYTFRVRAICSTGFTSDWSAASANFTTQIAPPVCGGNLVDSGGTAGNYGNNENSVITVIPTSGDLVTVTFTAFNTQAGNDILTIYDGPTTSSPLLATLSGTTLPPSYTASSATGELTFAFTSNATTTAAGYAANITCGPPPACRIPSAVTASAITVNSATINWIQPANPDSSVASVFDIIVLPANSAVPTAGSVPTINDVTAAAGPSYSVTGLASGTCYDIYVRAVCATNSGWSIVAARVCTLVAPPVCGGNYVDTGGTGGDYGNNATLTSWICPTTTADAVTVTFSAFNLATGDTIAIYDGDTTSATLLGTFSGTTLPPAFTSTAASGCLLFVFTSNATGTAPGWLANVTCAPKATCTPPIALTNNTVTHNSAVLNWVQQANPDTSVSTSWDVYVTSCGSPSPTAGTTPTVTVNTAPPYTLTTGLLPVTCYNVYVRSACGSTWTGPTVFTTLAAPPECGGNFVDNGGTAANYLPNSNVTTIICPTNPGDVVTVTFTAFNTEATWDALYVYHGNSVVPGNLIASANGPGNVPGGLAGGYWGNTIPCPFTSNAANGCLTFVFRSDGSVNNPGFISNITCAPPPTCAMPTAITSTASTFNSATLNWTQPANPDTTVASAWDIYYVACGSPAPTAATIPNATTTTAPPYTLQNLSPVTCYDIYVRANCGTSVSAWTCSPTTITTLAAPPICGGNFVDNGGTAAPYLPNSNVTTTICPTNPGDIVTVTFTSFNTEANWDALYVYNGTGTTGVMYNSGNPAANVPGGLAGGYWGTTIPCAFTSASADGCLTFVFRSDGSVNNPGWVANVTCAPPATCAIPTSLTSNTATHNSVVLNWTQPANPDTTVADAWDIYYVACGSPAPTAATIPNATTTTAPPYTLQNLSPATCYDIYVRANCGTSVSAWTCTPTTITTLAAPPICGGNFVDNGGVAAPYLPNSNVTTTICPTNPGDIVTVTFTSFNTEANWDALYVYNGTGTTGVMYNSGNPAANVPGGLAGGYWGTTIPCAFTSASADGCLTFVFRSDGSVNNPGWIADITCAPPPTCNVPAAFVATDVRDDNAVLNWTQPANADGSFATAWDIYYLTCGSPAPTAATVPNAIATTAPPYTLTGLTAASCYDIYIRANCGTSVSDWTCSPITITTLVTPPTCGEVFTDAGGTADPYENNSNIPTYICPQNPGDVVTVTFTSFNTDANNDGLYVYDGNSIGVNQIASDNGAGNVPGGIPGSYWGNLTGGNLPGPFTSTTADGCLTFVFRSNGFTTAPGWVANVTCTPAPTCARPLLIVTPSLDQTSVTLTWTQPLNPNGTQATAWEVFVLPGGSGVPIGAGFGVSGTPTYTLGGLTPGTTYEFYVRAICGPTDASIWSGFTFSTKPLNDECANAAFAIVNQNLNCVQTVHGTLVGATGSSPATTCGGAGAANDDVWFSFTATAVTHIISFNNVIPATPMSYAIYSGTCTGLTQVGCNSGANLIPGTTYYIRVFSTSATPVLTNFDMCIGTLPCTEAPAFCTGQTVTYANSTNVPSLGTIGCLNTSPNPAFFFLQVNNAGPLSYLISQVDNGGTPRDVDYVAWGPFTDLSTACSGVPANPLGQTVPIPTPTTGCPGTLHACSYSTAPQEIMCIPNAQLCEVYVIMITNFSNQAGTVTFTQTNNGGGTTACFPINTFNYSSTYYCQNAANPTPVLAPGAAAGVYSSTPGLVIDSVTGTIDLLASTPGPYVVTSTSATTIGGTCTTIPFITTTRTVIITAPASATISYAAATYCNNIPSAQSVVLTGTSGGTYSSTPAGLLLNAINGEIIPAASTPGVYTVTYTIPAIGGCVAYTTQTQVEILASPTVIQASLTACDSLNLPPLTAGNYYAAAGGVGTPLDPSIPITVSQPVYIYTVGTNGCITERSFNVTINTVPAPTYTVTQSTCTTPNGSITVTSPVSAGGPLPTNLFISEVTDAETGSLSYVEIYNGTGSAVNLNNYKIRTFNNGSPTATVGCENILSGTLNNNSTYVISVGSATNLGGVVPNQVFAGCSGVNIDDTIKLTTLTDTVIDVWGRTDGVAFTPLNQPGYTYRRLNTSTVPSVSWNPSDWTALDPEDYTDVGNYSYTVSNYQYSVDSGTFQTGTVFSNLAPGNHTLVVKDLATGCFSALINILIDAVTPTPTVTTFTYTTPVCQNATTNPLPDTSATGFTTGGTYSEVTTTGLVFVNTATGEIDLASTPGPHTVRYSVAFNPATCQAAGSTDFEIVINPIVNPVLGFSYTTPICQNAQTNLSPTLVAGFTSGGTFSSTTGLSINGTTGVIDLAASTPGNYTITYTSNPIASSCLVGGTNTFNIVINPGLTPVTGFSYNTPFCSSDAVNLQLPTLVSGFTTGGTFSSTTGLSVNGTTGEINIQNSTPGAYTITYTIPADASTCQTAGTSNTQIMIIAPVTIELTGGCQSVNYVLTANGSFNPETATFSWHNAAGTNVGDTQSITVTEIGVYTVTVTVDGCSTDSIPFDVESVFCIIQKGISVNNDGLNDTFDLTGYDVKKLTIFNRLGMKVYSRNDYVDEWGGKSDDGEELPDGTYYFIIDRNSGDAKTGWIYINRAQ